jgi:hypothetical protein
MSSQIPFESHPANVPYVLNKTAMRFIIITLLFLVAHTATGQILEPRIKFDLFFSDALGHRDTVTIGYDTLAGANIDPEFGEFNLRGIPFDSVFEVRGADNSGFEYQSNPTIQYYTTGFCIIESIVQYQSFIVYAKHWPITITWDSTYFAHQCYDWTHITRISAYMFQPQYANGDIRRLNLQDSVIITKNYMRQTVDILNSRRHPVEGIGLDTIYTVYIGLAGNDPTISTREVVLKAARVFPNPVLSDVHIEVPEALQSTDIEQITLTDMLGRQSVISAWDNRADALHIPVESYPAGVYAGKIRFRGEDRPVVFAFVKLPSSP